LIQVVFDNYPHQAGLQTGWGFAAYISTQDHNVLFDTGANGTVLLNNMTAMGINPADVETVVLSHEHNDHTGGLSQLLDRGSDPTIYLLPSFSSEFKSRYAGKYQVTEVLPKMMITKNTFSTGEISGSIREQALVLETQAGLVIITGCAHPGVDKIVRQARDQFEQPIYLVLGGFHLSSYSTGRVDRIINNLKDLGVEQVAPCHCTGDNAINQFRNAFGEDFLKIGVGAELEIEL
jgi:7,8-dihydropterin-6-yl-methyl-4-(beta-D-ribofuranosyl)aminobenzene 5'-phosphate synthase